MSEKISENREQVIDKKESSGLNRIELRIAIILLSIFEAIGIVVYLIKAWR